MKIRAVNLFVLLLFCVINSYSHVSEKDEQEFAGGNGSPTDPWLIETAEHLNNVRNYIGYDYYNKYFKQIASINLNVPPWNEGEGWLPIGGPDYDDFFMGQYHGNGHLINGLTINRPDHDHIGLFGGITVGSVSDLIMINPDITGGNFTGTIVGRAQNTNIENCLVFGGSLEGTGTGTGGLVGKSIDHVTIKNSANQSLVYGVENVGGIIGTFLNSIIENSYNRGFVEGSNNVGGIAGYAVEAGIAYVMNSFSSGFLSGNENIGGLIGKNELWGYVPVIESFWDMDISNILESDGGVGKTTEEMTSFSTFIEAGWDFKGAGIEEIWNIGNDRNDGYPYFNWQYPDDPAPDEPHSPMVETTGVSYYNITHESAIVDAVVVLQGNPAAQHGVCWNASGMPDFEDDCTDEGIVEQAGSFTSEITGLGMNQNYFVRAYVQNEHGIHFGEEVSFITHALEAVKPAGSGEENDPFLIDSLPNLLWITLHPEEWNKYYLQMSSINALETVGWFNGAGWMPIGNECYKFTGSYNGAGHYIENLYINRPDSNHVGFIGYADAAEIINLGLINLEFTGNSYVGGLTGRMGSNTARIENSFTTGSLNGYRHVGGLAGNYTFGGTTGGIINSYSNANVTGDSDVGGLLGSLAYGNMVYNCYSTGFVEGNTRVGGLIGHRSGNAPQNSRWNTQTSGQDHSAGGQGLTSSQMIIQGYFNGWDFDNIWEIDEGKSYPYLQWQQTPGGFNYPPMPLTVLISPEGTGAVIIDPEQDEYHFGDIIELTALSETGYKFQNWYMDGIAISSDIIFQLFFLGGEITLTAGFIQESTPLYSLSLTADPSEGGSVEGGGNFQAGESVQLRASPAEGYHFLNWTDQQGSIVNTQQEFIYQMPAQNTSLTANFSLIQYHLHVEALPDYGGYVEVIPEQEFFNMGDEITLYAHAEDGYIFQNWTDQDGNLFGDTDSLTLIMPAHDLILIANFEMQTYSLTRVVNPEEAGYIEVLPNQDYYHMGDEIYLDAYPNEGYVFVNWTDEDGNEIHQGQYLFYVMPAHDVFLTANFDLENLVSEINSGSILVYPNPAWDFIAVKSEESIERIFLLDISGKVIKTVQGNFYPTRLDLSDFPVGTYILKLETSGGFVSRIIQVVKH